MRKDIWLENDDQTLAKIVLKHVEEGSTQTKAFIEAAGVLGRTKQACAFRWNAEVRKRYVDQLNRLKSKTGKMRLVNSVNMVQTQIDTNIEQLLNEIRDLASELNEKVDQLETKIKLRTTEEYRELNNILDQAKNLLSQKTV